MAKHALLLLLVSLLYISSAAACKTTTYPALCVQSLSAFAPSIQQNPLQLTETAFSVSLASAQSIKTFVYKLTKFKGLKARVKEYTVLSFVYKLCFPYGKMSFAIELLFFIFVWKIV